MLCSRSSSDAPLLALLPPQQSDFRPLEPGASFIDAGMGAYSRTGSLLYSLKPHKLYRFRIGDHYAKDKPVTDDRRRADGFAGAG